MAPRPSLKRLGPCRKDRDKSHGHKILLVVQQRVPHVTAKPRVPEVSKTSFGSDYWVLRGCFQCGGAQDNLGHLQPPWARGAMGSLLKTFRGTPPKGALGDPLLMASCVGLSLECRLPLYVADSYKSLLDCLSPQGTHCACPGLPRPITLAQDAWLLYLPPSKLRSPPRQDQFGTSP